MARKKSGVTEQTKAAVHRLDDAQALFERNRFRGAMYVGGYAVECTLKARLMERYECRTLVELEAELVRRKLVPKDWTAFSHQLFVLTTLTGALARIKKDRRLWRLFNKVNTWLPAWRYNVTAPNRDEASDFLDAVRVIKHWLDANV